MKLTEYQSALLDKQVRSVAQVKLGAKTTVVLITTKNGFEIVGTSACVNPADFNEGIGIHYALVDALNKLDELLGFARQQELFKGE
jgi:hypothetical protein